MSKLGVFRSKPEHEIAFQEIAALLDKHAGKLTSLEMLAIAANMVGKLVALQDQRYVTPEKAMNVVIENIQNGNKQVIDDLHNSIAGNA
jgi:hypothetical protein